MKLYILEAITNWEPWYDTMRTVVVTAESVEQARELASRTCGDEGPPVWFDTKLTTCKEFKPGNVARIEIRDHRGA